MFKGGVISYCNEIKHRLLGVEEALLEKYGAVSAPVAEAMALGARAALGTDMAVSVTGLAGPGGDEFGNPVGTVFLGWTDGENTRVKHCLFSGSREEIRRQAVEAALTMILENMNPKREVSQ